MKSLFLAGTLPPSPKPRHVRSYVDGATLSYGEHKHTNVNAHIIKVPGYDAVDCHHIRLPGNKEYLIVEPENNAVFKDEINDNAEMRMLNEWIENITDPDELADAMAYRQTLLASKSRSGPSSYGIQPPLGCLFIKIDRNIRLADISWLRTSGDCRTLFGNARRMFIYIFTLLEMLDFNGKVRLDDNAIVPADLALKPYTSLSSVSISFLNALGWDRDTGSMNPTLAKPPFYARFGFWPNQAQQSRLKQIMTDYSQGIKSFNAANAEFSTVLEKLENPNYKETLARLQSDS